jgi:hypothetical protein
MKKRAVINNRDVTSTVSLNQRGRRPQVYASGRAGIHFIAAKGVLPHASVTKTIPQLSVRKIAAQ